MCLMTVFKNAQNLGTLPFVKYRKKAEEVFKQNFNFRPVNALDF